MIQQEKIKKVLCLFCVLFSVGLVLPITTRAAQLNLTSQAQEIKMGGKFEVSFFLNTEEESINAVEGKILFPEKLLELKEIKDGNSIVNFWVERPRSDSAGSIIFSGITPGGFKSENGLVFSLVFEPKEKNKGQIEFSGIRALKNDGLGTPADVLTRPLEFEIKEADLAPEESIEIKARDYEPPESFAPEIARNESMFGGKWFLVFATQDKGSGIGHYEVKEQKRARIWKKWKAAESPYLLEDQNLRSYVYVKAIDKAGNERMAVVEPRYPMRWYEKYLVWGIIIVIVIFIYIVFRLLNNSILSFPPASPKLQRGERKRESPGRATRSGAGRSDPQKRE
ncbi:MAG: cohesin domain-containing protein [bacterium]|nr:cohesin domain-containing protein [bacterium]